MAEMQPGVVSHSDLEFMEYLERRDSDYDLDDDEKTKRRLAQAVVLVDYAQMALETYYPGMPKDEAVRISEGLAHVVDMESSRRGAHYHRYRLMTQAGLNDPILAGTPESLPLPERSLLDLRHRTENMSEETYAFAKVLSGKGISAELGHVDQLGDWDAAGALDRQLRKLPESEALKQAGFRFGNLYDSKDHAKLDYSFNVTGSLGNTIMIAKRKRAAADVHAGDDDDRFEVVKHSSFLITERLLSRTDRQLLNRVKELGSVSKKTAVQRDMFDGAINEAGMTIVEPLVSEREIRGQHAGVIAATSLYFALYRHR